MNWVSPLKNKQIESYIFKPTSIVGCSDITINKNGSTKQNVILKRDGYEKFIFR